jgi:Cof subfamily protein (haloacid dehalogenase superfamily)
MSIRLIALDMDGTLLGEDHMHISDRTVRVLRSAANRGIYIVPASGRTMSQLSEILRRLDCVRYAITANGAAVMDLREGKPLFTSLIPPEPSACLLRMAEEIPWLNSEAYYGGNAFLEPKGQKYLEKSPSNPAFKKQLSASLTFVDSLRPLMGLPLEKIRFNEIPEEHMEEFRALLRKAGSFQESYDRAESLELNAPGVSKGAALAELCRGLGIAREEVMAFGDSNNDLTMIRWAGHSFAMANGTEEIKQAAAYEAPSNAEEGVAVKTEEFLRIAHKEKSAPLIREMTLYNAGDRSSVNHFLKVLSYAKVIGELEGIDPDTRYILETAAVVHDIGIKPAKEKYKSSAGPYQEAEGPAPARDMLARLQYDPAVIDRVCYLVGHHHTYNDIYGADYQILVEADFLVNLDEGKANHKVVEEARQNIFKTTTGLFFLGTLFPA